MARLEAVIDANINPFQAKLEEAKEKAAEFQEKLGDVGKDLLKNLSGINIGEALQLGVGIYAAKQLGEALVDAAKEGYAEFQKFQDAVLSFKYTLPSSAGDLAEREKLAKEEAEAAEKRVGAFDFDTQYRTAQALIQASRIFGESMEKTDDMAKHLTALAIITRSTPEAEAENLRRALVSRAEDSGAALGKFFKRTPGLEEQARLLREQEAARRPAEAAEIRRMGIPEFMAKETRGKTDEEIIRLLTEMVSKAAPLGVIEERKAAHPEEALVGPLEAMRSAFGEKLLPVVAQLTDLLLAALPAIKEFGLDLLDVLVPILGDVITIFQGVASAVSFVASAFTPVREALESFGTFIRETVLVHIGELAAWFGQIAESTGLVDAFGEAIQAAASVGSVITNAFKNLIDPIVKMVSEILEATHAMDLLQIGIDTIKSRVIAAFTLIADTIKTAAEIITRAVDWIRSHVPFLGGPAGAGAAGAGGGGGVEAAAAESAKKALEAPFAESAEGLSAAYKKAAQEAATIQLKSDATHAEVARRINAEAEAFDIRQAARAEARSVLSRRPVGMTEALDKEYAARAAEEAKIINIRAEAAIKINAAEEEAAEKKAKIQEEADERSLKRAEEDKNTFGMTQDEIDARTAVRRAEDAASATAIMDAQKEAAEKIREANADAANAIIDAQIEAADKIIDAQEAAALRALDKMKGPYATEAGPATKPEFGHWKGGVYHESEFERKQREERNSAAEEANRQWKELQRMAIEKEFEEKKLAVEDALERQRPTMIGLKRIHQVQQEEQARVEGEAEALEKEMTGKTRATPHIKLIEAQEQVKVNQDAIRRQLADTAFVAEHAKGYLPPPEPAKEGKEAADVSRKVVAELIVKYLDEFTAYKKEFEGVFVSS